VSKEQNESKTPMARAELYDNGDDTYQLVASVNFGSFKLEIDRAIDMREDEQKVGKKAGKKDHLKTVK
jgi:hypothetical protein